jgi:hypothetical protein
VAGPGAAARAPRPLASLNLPVQQCGQQCHGAAAAARRPGVDSVGPETSAVSGFPPANLNPSRRLRSSIFSIFFFSSTS